MRRSRLGGETARAGVALQRPPDRL